MSELDVTQPQVYEQPQPQVTNPPEADTSSQEVASESTTQETETSSVSKEEQQKQESSLFLENKRAQGYQLTHINENETNFFQYGEALSQELKDSLLASFDCEQDYVLQKEIAELFKQGNVWQTNTLINQLYSMGYTVNLETISTQYITDWKNGRASYLREDGAINVLTISDGKGGEIKIADANGNGAIECEELFMNEILEGLASDKFFAGDIGEVIGGKSGGGHSSGGASGSSAHSLFSSANSDLDDSKNASKKKIAQSKYNQLIDDYIAKHNCSSVSEAISQINAQYNYTSNDFEYTGKFKGVNLAMNNNTPDVENAIQTSDAETENSEELALV